MCGILRLFAPPRLLRQISCFRWWFWTEVAYCQCTHLMLGKFGSLFVKKLSNNLIYTHHAISLRLPQASAVKGASTHARVDAVNGSRLFWIFLAKLRQHWHERRVPCIHMDTKLLQSPRPNWGAFSWCNFYASREATVEWYHLERRRGYKTKGDKHTGEITSVLHSVIVFKMKV